MSSCVKLETSVEDNGAMTILLGVPSLELCVKYESKGQ
jgi:hypothetical protein